LLAVLEAPGAREDESAGDALAVLDATGTQRAVLVASSHSTRQIEEFVRWGLCTDAES
jgi:succinate dehydrogenase/fumarate reductase flavoprotein subunit